MVRYCASCGTEVDETAIFCPTCGQPIDEAADAEIPAAPAWPEPPSPPGGPEAVTERGASSSEPARTWAAPPTVADEPTRAEPRVVSAAPPPVAPARGPDTASVRPAGTSPPGSSDVGRRERPSFNLPITTPVTLSAWLIGGGALLAALGVLIGLFDVVLNPVELILLIALLAIAATVFFSNVPAIPNLRLATLVVVLIGFGIALDRLGFGAAGVGELLLFLGTAAAAIGAILVEVGRDQPLGPSR